MNVSDRTATERTATGSRTPVPLRRPIRRRSVTEGHRHASHLELLFDLTFVIAIARITTELSRGLASGDATDSAVAFAQVIFAIWWAWMNFTWFASAYDNDDAAFRLVTMLQMAGVLVLASGVEPALDHGELRRITIGYLIMRVGLVALWLRTAAECAEARRVALRYAGGITALEVAWIARLVIAEAGWIPAGALLAAFIVLAVGELSVPWWAERAGGPGTTWHPHHIAERYGLLVIILLGESLLTASSGVRAAVDGGGGGIAPATVAASGFVLTMALWWWYFLDEPGAALAEHRHRSFRWGYGHFGVIAALAALGAGLECAAEATAGHVHAPAVVVAYGVAAPVALFLVALAALNGHLSGGTAAPGPGVVLTVTAVLAAPLAAPVLGAPTAIAVVAGACAALVGIAGIEGGRPHPRPTS